jgi:hypothetical protein
MLSSERYPVSSSPKFSFRLTNSIRIHGIDAGQERVASQRWCRRYRARGGQYQAARVTAMSSRESLALAF